LFFQHYCRLGKQHSISQVLSFNRGTVHVDPASFPPRPQAVSRRLGRAGRDRLRAADRRRCSAARALVIGQDMSTNAQLALIPGSAPFAEGEIEILNRVVGPASPIQRAWLAGFLAGLDASQTQPVPAAPAQPAEPLTILYATESGNSEKLASDVAKAARKQGLKPTLIDMAELEMAALTSAKR